MKTQIFKNYSDFYHRDDKSINGVSEDFAKENPNYEEQNKNNEGCWNCSRCSRCSDCSGCSDCSDCSRCSDCSCCSDCSDCSDCSRCSGCSGCSRCSRCSDCSRCSRCSRCSDCSDCSDCSRCSDCSCCSRCSRCSRCSDCSDVSNRDEEFKSPDIPVIKNIHQKVLEAVSKPDAFEMSHWHKCETTHCRAGWVVHLAGKAGYALERFHDTPLAAYLIYKKSSDIKVSMRKFYDSNTVAMDDIKKCAEEEKAVAK